MAVVESEVAGTLDRLLDDFEWFSETFLWVQDKETMRIVRMRLKPVQRRLARHILERYLAGLPVRVMVLKARRQGVSTLLQAIFYWLCSTREHQRSVTLSHHDDTTRELHEIAERYYRHSPPWLRPMKRKSRRGQVMEFANPSLKEETREADPGLQSTMTTVTAKNAGAGQGAKLVHLSEVALYESNQIDAKSLLDTLLQIIPWAAYTIVALESTAKGVGGEFYRRWKLAEASLAAGRDTGFYPFFIPWFEEPTSILPGHPPLGDLDAREQRLRDRYGCSDSQIAWRRWIGIPDLCGGDPDTFDEQYPESAEVAFLATGRPYFDQEACAEALEEARTVEPLARGDLNEIDGRAVWRDNRHGKITVWGAPEPDEDYLIVLDPSEGSADDPQAAVVLKRSSLEQVAAWHGYVDRMDLGDQMFMLGHLYGEALIAVEMSGGWGHSPLVVLRKRGYTRLYREVVEGKKRRKRGIRYGWYTTETSRPLALDALGEAIRGGEYASADPGFWGECLTFVYAETGKPQAEVGCHDDRVMAAAVGVRLWQTEPRRRRNRGAEPERRVLSGVTGY